MWIGEFQRHILRRCPKGIQGHRPHAMLLHSSGGIERMISDAPMTTVRSRETRG